MKKIYVFVLIIAMLTALFSFTGCKDEALLDTSLRVMSFNIRTLAMEDDSANNWGNGRKERVIKVIEDYSPDIVGMQEVKIPQYSYLVSNLPDYDSYGVERTGIGISEMSAIFYKKERFERVEEYSFWFSDTPDEVSIGWDASTYRICSVLKLRDKLSGEEISFFNSHFDHIGTQAREQSSAMIKERTLGIDNAIATGDLNFDEGSASYDSVLSGDLEDSKYLAPEGQSDSGATYQGYSAPNPEGLPIDFILLHSGSFEVKEYRIIKVTYDDGLYPSDHCPIYADIDYKA